MNERMPENYWVNIEYMTVQAEKWAKRSPRTKAEILAYMEATWNALEGAGCADSIRISQPIEKILYKTRA